MSFLAASMGEAPSLPPSLSTSTQTFIRLAHHPACLPAGEAQGVLLAKQRPHPHGSGLKVPCARVAGAGAVGDVGIDRKAEGLERRILGLREGAKSEEPKSVFLRSKDAHVEPAARSQGFGGIFAPWPPLA